MSGDTQSTTRLAAIGVETGEVKWVDHGQQKRDVQLGPAGLVRRRDQGRDRGPRRRQQGPLDLRARSRHRQDARAGQSDHDDAWVDGPGANTIGWMKNDREVYFQSEKHRLLAPLRGGLGWRRAARAHLGQLGGARACANPKDKSHFYLTASKDSPYEQHLYEMDGDGGPLTRLTEGAGQARRHRLSRRALDRRHLLLHQQAAGAVRRRRTGRWRRRRSSPPRPRPSSLSIRGWMCPS